MALVNGFEINRFDTIIIIICYATMFGPLEIFIYVPNLCSSWNFNSWTDLVCLQMLVFTYFFEFSSVKFVKKRVVD